MENERFTVKFTETEQENLLAYSLRFTDMLKEYRPETIRENDLDITPYDSYAKQIICIDNQTGGVVGCYRIITSDNLPNGEKFACEEEFDITSLKNSGEKIAELSRAVVKKEYRNTLVLMMLLRFIIKHVKEENYRFVVGEASFFGTDKSKYVKEFSYLSANYSCKDYGIKSLEKEQVELLSVDQFDQIEVKRSLPPLIRAYTTIGAKISDDSFTDREFGSVDVFVLMDTQHTNDAYIKKFFKL